MASLPWPALADVATQDADERAILAREQPLAARTLQEAESADGAGDRARAAGLFARARALAPRSPLPPRRHCETLVALGRKAEAVAACERAKSLGGGPLEMRAMVSALLAGGGPLPSDDLALAWFYASQLARNAPMLPLAQGARCEIALRIGDGRLLESCLDRLKIEAPDGLERRRVLAAVAARPHPWAGLALAAIIALASLFTLGHAARRASRRRNARRTPTPAAALSLVALGMVLGPPLVGPVSAAAARPPASGSAAPSPGDAPPHKELSGGTINHADPEGSVPGPAEARKNPLQYGYVIQDLLALAEKSRQLEDHAAEVRYYRALVKMVPDRSTGFVKLCQAYEKVGDRQRATEACALALTTNGATVEDHVRFVRLVLGKDGPLTTREREAVLQSVNHLRGEPANEIVGHHLECELALRINDGSRLERCAAALAARAPRDPKTISIQWAVAMKRQDRAEAERLLERAREAGVQPDALARMEALLEDKLRWPRRWLLGGFGLLLLGCLGLAALVWSNRRRPGPTPA